MEEIRRYTNLAALVHMLRTKSITLLNPASWDDKNDAYFMAEYKRYKAAESVLALCFAERGETYHQWRVFSNGADGVRVDFSKARLLSTFEGDSRVTHRSVRYLTLPEVERKRVVDVDSLPFLKRYPYRDEGEYRVVYTDQQETLESVSYDIRLAWILRVTLSPWMPSALRASVRRTLRELPGCKKLRVQYSTVVNNESWKKLAARARRT